MALAAADERLSAKRLFDRVFWPLYPPDAREHLSSGQPAPVIAANDSSILLVIDDIADIFSRITPGLLNLPDEALDGSDASVHRLSHALTRQTRDRLLAETTIGEPRVPMLAMLCIHGALYLGRCAVRNHGGVWVVRNPLWESTVQLRTVFGQGELTPFYWWVKSLSDDEIDRVPLSDRYRTHVENPCFDATSLPVLAPDQRRIPRIGMPTYQQLFGHLKEHAPEIRHPGDDFPSPERFEQMRFQWMDFAWVGGGRLLLMHGPSLHQGVHLFWMDAGGFTKAAFYPADDTPAHCVRQMGDVLRVIVSIQHEVRYHDVPWWGP